MGKSIYETVIVARPNMPASQLDALANRITGLIGERGGEVGVVERWGLRNLAYRIRKNRKAHYVFVAHRSEVGVLNEVERQLRLNEDVLRYLSVKVDAFPETPTIAMQDAREQGDRGRLRGGFRHESRDGPGGRDRPHRDRRISGEENSDSAPASPADAPSNTAADGAQTAATNSADTKVSATTDSEDSPPPAATTDA